MAVDQTIRNIYSLILKRKYDITVKEDKKEIVNFILNEKYKKMKSTKNSSNHACNDCPECQGQTVSANCDNTTNTSNLEDEIKRLKDQINTLTKVCPSVVWDDCSTCSTNFCIELQKFINKVNSFEQRFLEIEAKLENCCTSSPSTYSAVNTAMFTKQCPSGQTGSQHSFSRTYTSTVSQQDADNKKQAGLAQFNIDGQSNANVIGTCSGGGSVLQVNYTNYNCSTKQVVGSISGGTAPYSYSINNQSFVNVVGNTFTISNLVNGTYAITVKDSNNQQFIQTVNVNCVTGNITYATTGYNCLANSIVIQNITGGTAPYSYKLDSNLSQTISSNTFTLSNVSSGNHTIEIRDSLGLTTLYSFVVNCSCPINFNLINYSCNLQVAGLSIVSGGTAPYQYKIDNGLYLPSGLTQGFGPLTNGTHVITVKDSNNIECSKNLTVNCNASTVPTFSNPVVIQPNCNSNTTGKITFNNVVNGDRYNYCNGNTFGCNNDCSTPDGFITSGTFTFDSQYISGLGNKSYTIRIYNGTNCTLYTDYTVNFTESLCGNAANKPTFDRPTVIQPDAVTNTTGKIIFNNIFNADRYIECNDSTFTCANLCTSGSIDMISGNSLTFDSDYISGSGNKSFTLRFYNGTNCNLYTDYTVTFEESTNTTDFKLLSFTDTINRVAHGAGAHHYSRLFNYVQNVPANHTVDYYLNGNFIANSADPLYNLGFGFDYKLIHSNCCGQPNCGEVVRVVLKDPSNVAVLGADITDPPIPICPTQIPIGALNPKILSCGLTAGSNTNIQVQAVPALPGYVMRAFLDGDSTYTPVATALTNASGLATLVIPTTTNGQKYWVSQEGGGLGESFGNSVTIGGTCKNLEVIVNQTCGAPGTANVTFTITGGSGNYKYSLTNDDVNSYFNLTTLNLTNGNHLVFIRDEADFDYKVMVYLTINCQMTPVILEPLNNNGKILKINPVTNLVTDTIVDIDLGLLQSYILVDNQWSNKNWKNLSEAGLTTSQVTKRWKIEDGPYYTTPLSKTFDSDYDNTPISFTIELVDNNQMIIESYKFVIEFQN